MNSPHFPTTSGSFRQTDRLIDACVYDVVLALLLSMALSSAEPSALDSNKGGVDDHPSEPPKSNQETSDLWGEWLIFLDTALVERPKDGDSDVGLAQIVREKVRLVQASETTGDALLTSGLSTPLLIMTLSLLATRSASLTMGSKSPTPWTSLI